MHAHVIGNGLPVQLELSPGPAGDAPIAELLLNEPPKCAVALADKASDADCVRNSIDEQGFRACIPPRVHSVDDIAISKRPYKTRKLIDRVFNKLKQFRNSALASTVSPSTTSPCKTRFHPLLVPAS